MVFLSLRQSGGVLRRWRTSLSSYSYFESCAVLPVSARDLQVIQKESHSDRLCEMTQQYLYKQQVVTNDAGLRLEFTVTFGVSSGTGGQTVSQSDGNVIFSLERLFRGTSHSLEHGLEQQILYQSENH